MELYYAIWPTSAQRIIFDLLDTKYDWKGKMVNDKGDVALSDEDNEA